MRSLYCAVGLIFVVLNRCYFGFVFCYGVYFVLINIDFKFREIEGIKYMISKKKDKDKVNNICV